MLAARPVIAMGPRTDSSCCCQARNLSWAPVTVLLNAAARSRVCLWVPCNGLPLLLSLSPHSAMCHLSGLLTLLVVSIYVIGCCMASPLLLPPRHNYLWLHTLVLAPVTAK
ncbi:unnamed protein product [Staurois parvus]|uniref:Uncharacterized protein n=1 Tax=Staurois parvus TaxID=386267 RepID=A0ABN9EJF7_9NEOB|nr:unnamed protein product [Staurois parvus]